VTSDELSCKIPITVRVANGPHEEAEQSKTDFVEDVNVWKVDGLR